MGPDPTSLSASEEIMEVIADAQLMGLKLETQEGAKILGRLLHQHLRDLADTFRLETVTRLNDFLSLWVGCPSLWNSPRPRISSLP